MKRLNADKVNVDLNNANDVRNFESRCLALGLEPYARLASMYTNKFEEDIGKEIDKAVEFISKHIDAQISKKVALRPDVSVYIVSTWAYLKKNRDKPVFTYDEMVLELADMFGGNAKAVTHISCKMNHISWTASIELIADSIDNSIYQQCIKGVIYALSKWIDILNWKEACEKSDECSDTANKAKELEILLRGEQEGFTMTLEDVDGCKIVASSEQWVMELSDDFEPTGGSKLEKYKKLAENYLADSSKDKLESIIQTLKTELEE